MLRGIVMMLMVLDHTRDFFGNPRFDPTDLTRTNAPLFFTRWATHFCAPVFMFLAGTSAYLWMAAGNRTKRELSTFLASRGLWLVLLEVVVVREAWWPAIVPHFVPLQVIWALGASMIVLAALVRLPVWAVVTVGLGMILGHDLLDGIHASALGSLRPLWLLLHEAGPISLGASLVFYVAYPLVPWIGVMATGYALGPLVMQERETRRKQLIAIGGAVLLTFVVLRAVNLYGDPHPWTVEPTLGKTVLSFLNCAKYPPSLAYLAMTLGPALLVLGALDRPLGPVLQRVAVIGRVPLFFYVMHLYLLRVSAIAVDTAVHGAPIPELLHRGVFSLPVTYGYGLPIVYGVWAAAILLLYPASVWFAGLKARKRGTWWVGYV